MDIQQLTCEAAGPRYHDVEALIQSFFTVTKPGALFLENNCYLPETVASTLSLTLCIYVPLFYVGTCIFSMLGFKGSARWELSSTAPSLLHGVVSTYVASIYFIRHWCTYGDLIEDARNVPEDIDLLKFSTAYFLQDLFIYIGLYARHEILFAMHHVAVVLYMAQSLYFGYGNISSVLTMSMGEITSPLQNLWFWLKHMRYERKWADDAFAYVSWMYSAFYIFIRSFFGLSLVAYNMYKVGTSSSYSWWFQSILVLILGGGVMASQLWCLKISKRLRAPYRSAYGKRRIETAPMDSLFSPRDDFAAPVDGKPYKKLK